MKNRSKAFFRKCESGVAAVEFALVLPILLVLLIGVIEIGRYNIIMLKINKTASALADYPTQGTIVTMNQLQSYVDAANHLLDPFPINGTIIFSSVARAVPSTPPLPVDSSLYREKKNFAMHQGVQVAATGASGFGSVTPEMTADDVSASVPKPANCLIQECVVWQRTFLGGEASLIGATGAFASLPNGLKLLPGEDVIVAEFFQRYEPIMEDITPTFISALSPQTLYSVGVYMPRTMDALTQQPQ